MMKRRGFIQSIAAGIAALFGVRAQSDDRPEDWRHFYNNDPGEESFAGLIDNPCMETSGNVMHIFRIAKGDERAYLVSESRHSQTVPYEWHVEEYIGFAYIGSSAGDYWT